MLRKKLLYKEAILPDADCTGPERDSTSTCREYSKERQCEFIKDLKRRVLQGGKREGW